MLMQPPSMEIDISFLLVARDHISQRRHQAASFKYDGDGRLSGHTKFEK
jgi:hypothetical protein